MKGPRGARRDSPSDGRLLSLGATAGYAFGKEVNTLPR